MASGTGSQQQKISPRKFSEKIALLNKKEQEGNAKFEEIIKEVQATRNHQHQHHVAHQKQPASHERSSYHDATTMVADEIEEVYENLIRCVDQYEEELHDGDRTIDFISASARLECHPSKQFKTTPCDTNDLEPFNEANQQEIAGTAGRARVISFGSAASYRYSYANSGNNQTGWLQTGNPNQNYLEPTNDRSRQKSCSDPALNAPTNNGMVPYQTGNDLPNIKICAIDDELNQQQLQQQTLLQMHQQQNIGGSSRDSSLPDISRIQFENNCSPDKNMINTFSDSCQAMDGSWTSCGCPAVDNMSNFDTSTLSLSSQPQQSIGAYQDQSCPESTIKASNFLSNSDCGLTSSVQNYDVQHGNLMICNSSDQTNNIIRSRSHSNIDHLMKQGKGDCNTNNENFISQHCQQITHSKQCVSPKLITLDGSKRIVSLKTHESSISPLGSSSNLNSPQSGLNSPGSSTTDYCDASQMYLQNTNTICQAPINRECYHYESTTNGIRSTIIGNTYHNWPSAAPSTTVGHNLNDQSEFFLQPHQQNSCNPYLHQQQNQNSNIEPCRQPSQSIRRSQDRAAHRTFSPF